MAAGVFATIGQVFHVGGFRFHDRRIAGISDGFDRYGVYARDAAPLPAAMTAAFKRPR